MKLSELLEKSNVFTNVPSFDHQIGSSGADLKQKYFHVVYKNANIIMVDIRLEQTMRFTTSIAMCSKQK